MISPAEIALTLKERYLFNLTKNYVIWFSDDPEKELGLENARHLFAFRRNNPNFALSLIYSADSLSPDSIFKLENLCAQLNITPVKFEDLEARLQEPTDRALFAIARNEINHAKYSSQEGGNMAAAADAVRQMRYVIETYGNYHDFDVTILLSRLNADCIELKGPCLLTTEVVDYGSAYQVSANSDFLAFSLEANLQRLSPAAWQGLKACQQQIISNYDGAFVCEKILQGKAVSDFIAVYPELPVILEDFYTQYPGERTVFDFRKYLRNLPISALDQDRSESLASFFLRLSVISMSGPGNGLMYFKAHFPARETKAPIFIPKKDLKKWQPFINILMGSGLGFYNVIYDAVKTGNSAYAALENRNKKSDLKSHQSWTQTGRAAKLERERVLLENASKIFGFWRRHTQGKQEVVKRHLAIHIKKLCTDKEQPILDAIKAQKYGLAFRRACFGLKLPIVKLILASGIPFDINELTGKDKTALDLIYEVKGDARIKAPIITMVEKAGGKRAEEVLGMKCLSKG